MASQITGVSIVYSTVCSGEDHRKHQNPASLAFVRGIHRWPMNSPHKGPVTRKRFPFDNAIIGVVYPLRCYIHRTGKYIAQSVFLREPATIGSLWLENDLDENELEFKSHMGKLKENVRVISNEINGNPWDMNICIAHSSHWKIYRTKRLPKGTSDYWLPLARKWPRWKWTWI